MFIKFTAENLTPKSAMTLARKLKADGVAVKAVGMDPDDKNHMHMVCDIEWNKAPAIRQKVWDLNQGLGCEFYTITTAQLEELV